MPTILDKIKAYKLDEVAARKTLHPLADIEAEARNAPPIRRFADALGSAANQGYGLIAEIKKASPSKGLIRDDFDPPELAKAYQAGGAACLSVLTDTPSFQGDDSFLVVARAATDLPVLRKDFVYDPWQVVESRALGADCILIIMASVDDSLAADLETVAMEWQMDVLIEVHDAPELERAMRLQSPLLGINNRNLHTFETSLQTTHHLARLVDPDRMIVAESGLSTRDDLADLARYGARAFLIGEALMRQQDVEQATRDLLSNPADSPGDVTMALTHFDKTGQAHMVDVSEKPVTARQARAEGYVKMSVETLEYITKERAQKGDVLGVARLAGIMGAKRTSDLIPLCHPLPVTKVAVDLVADPSLPGVNVTATVKTGGQTGVEMEALTAVSIACLTIYDMLKAVQKDMQIDGIRLVFKDGGKSGRFEATR